jgi:hypothetical protein
LGVVEAGDKRTAVWIRRLSSQDTTAGLSKRVTAELLYARALPAAPQPASNHLATPREACMALYVGDEEAVESAKERLDRLVAFVGRDPECSTRNAATDLGHARSGLYKLRNVVVDLLAKRRPGPDPQQAREAALRRRITALEAERDTLAKCCQEQQTRLQNVIEFTAQMQAVLILILVTEHVSLRGIQHVFSWLTRGRIVPSLGSLSQQIRRAGRRARDWMATARAKIAARLTHLAGDDIFFHREPVKVLIEPWSMAVLQVLRWPWHCAEDWALMLEEYPALVQFTCDLAKDTTGGGALRGVGVQSDLFHDARWYDRMLLQPLDRAEREAREVLQQAQDQLPTWRRPTAAESRRLARLQQAVKDCEQQYYLAVQAEEWILQLYRPRRPDGLWWTDRAIDAQWDRIAPALTSIKSMVGERVCKHVEQFGRLFTTHTRVREAVTAKLRPDTHWKAMEIQQSLATVWDLERNGSVQSVRTARKLRAKLAKACCNLAEIEAQLRKIDQIPPRSSSGAESLNSQYRVLQMVHRYVSDELLSLKSFAMNMTPREEGPRKGRTPYELLGVDLGAQDSHWAALLIDQAA